MELRILGPVELIAGDEPVALAGAKQRAVLAVLVLHLNEVVPTDRLIQSVWGEAAPAAAAKNLQTYVSGLRRALRQAGADGALVTRGGGYALQLEPERVDARRFERLVAEGRAACDPARAAELLRAALALWRGPPLVDFSYSAFAQAEISRLDELHATALEARIDADLSLGRHAAVVGELEGLVISHPERERLAGQLMIALYRCGRQADALDVYQRIRAHLDTELGLEPGPELKALQHEILNQTLAAPQLPSLPAVRVPRAPTPTVGREQELERLQAELADPATRLLTVIGPGGMGKTRMAIEIGGRTRQRDGVVFVALAPLAGAEHVAPAIAAALSLPAIGDAPLEDQLARHLSGRELLLILDNFEHVLEAGPLVAELLAAAPGLSVLATSREPLRIRAERTCVLPPLGAAVELFLQVVRARDAGYAPGDDELGAIRALCRRLDGLPLAIELAAGRVGVLSPREISERLDEGLDVLAHGPRDAPGRHRALRATLAWSHELLEPDEQAAFARLGVFAGGADLATACAVTGATHDVLEALVDKQLVVLTRGPNDQRRVGMLETVRSFSRERFDELGHANDVSRRHAEHYLGVAETIAAELRRTAAFELLLRLEPEIDNIRAALSWALARPEPELALRLAVAFDQYLTLRRPTEGEHWVGAALALSGDDVPARVRAAALHRRGYQLNFHATWTRAEQAGREADALYAQIDDAAGRGQSLTVVAYSLLFRSRPDEAAAVAADAVTLARRAGEETTLADALSLQACVDPSLAAAMEAGAAAEVLYEHAGNVSKLAGVANDVGYRALCEGDYDAADRLLRRARGAAAAAGPAGEVITLHIIGSVALLALFQGQHRPAARAFHEELVLAREHGVGRSAHEALVGVAAVAAAIGEPVAAARLYGAAEAFFADPRNGAIPLDQGLLSQLEPIFAEAEAEAGADFWAGARAAGACLDTDAALELALSAAANLAGPTATASWWAART